MQTMDSTFISIHDLSQDARILYVSNSITDILGFSPEEVIGRSCWDYFHPDELPFARSTHGRGVSLDRAAVLNYCRIKNKASRWVGCECVFTVVYDVLVGCTSVYHLDSKSQKRARDAPIIRQLFSSSPKDPRYHMLSYISAKFSQGPRAHLHEPRAALFLNRFTRTLTVMYATGGLTNVLGITPAELIGKSFYFCIAENCLPEAVRCLEGAKANDSIAYLRFLYRDPRQDDLIDHDERMSSSPSDQDSDEGGVRLNAHTYSEESTFTSRTTSTASLRRRFEPAINRRNDDSDSERATSLSPSSTTTDTGSRSMDQVFDSKTGATRSSGTSLSPDRHQQSPHGQKKEQSLELEAVVSCTSDGLVVVIREARPFIADSLRSPAKVTAPQYTNGSFASPWGAESILPTSEAAVTSYASGVTKNPLAQYLAPSEAATAASPIAQPQFEMLMQTIRQCAVFAWALTGINGSLTQYARGSPAEGAQPYSGLPVWEPDADKMQDQAGDHLSDAMEE